MNEARVYKNEFSSWQDVLDEFRIAGLEPAQIFACYDADWEGGTANIVYFHEGEWLYVTGSHCSCFGLEGQWKPEAFDPLLAIEAYASGRYLISTDDVDLFAWLAAATLPSPPDLRDIAADHPQPEQKERHP